MSTRDLIPVPGGMADGNAFAILGKCTRAARRAGWPKDDIDAFRTEAMRGDYDHLLVTVTEHFDLEPEGDDG